MEAWTSGRTIRAPLIQAEPSWTDGTRKPFESVRIRLLSRTEDESRLPGRDVVQQDRLQGLDRDLVDPADPEGREEPLERGVGRGEDGELAMTVQGVHEAGPDDRGDQVIELAGPGVDRDGGLDDRRARAGGDGLGAEAENEGPGCGKKSKASHG